MIIPTSSTMTNKDGKYTKLGLQQQRLWSIIKKPSSSVVTSHLLIKSLTVNSCLSSLIKYASKKICCPNTHFLCLSLCLSPLSLFLYIYIYILIHVNTLSNTFTHKHTCMHIYIYIYISHSLENETLNKN